MNTLLLAYDSLHREHIGARAHFSCPKDPALLGKLAKARDNDPVTLAMLMREFFERPPDFAKAHGYSVGIFYSQVPRLIAQIQARQPRPVAESWQAECRRLHARACGHRAAHVVRMER